MTQPNGDEHSIVNDGMFSKNKDDAKAKGSDITITGGIFDEWGNTGIRDFGYYVEPIPDGVTTTGRGRTRTSPSTAQDSRF